MSTKPEAAPNLDQMRLYRALEAILRSPVTGGAVAEALTCQAAERDVRTLVADLRARRAQDAYDRDADDREEARLSHDRPPTPWARPA
jgi:hypothetical protein